MSQDSQQLVMPPRREVPPLPSARETKVQPGSLRPAPARTRISTDHLSGAQKAAIIVRVLLSEGLDTPLAALPPDMQATLTQTLGTMRLVDRATMEAVVEEFVETLDQVGLSFPDGLEGALSLLDGKLDERAARQLRALTRSDGQDDPWTRLELSDEEELIPILQAEAQVVGAVLLSKLSTDKAARLLMKLPADLAQALAIAISRTEDIAPDAVARIGAALAEQVGSKPAKAFATPSSKRVGEILNASPSALRQQLLAQLSDLDADFASCVREAIFTFDHIADCVEARDVPAIMREVATEDLLIIMACNRSEDMKVINFLLENMSKRVAETLREDAAARAAPSPDLHEAALNRVAASVRAMADDGRIALRRPKAPK